MFFFLTYLLIYGTMNAYVLRKLVVAFDGGSREYLLGAVVIAVVLFLPVALHRLDDLLPHTALRVLTLCTFCWMGAVLWLDTVFFIFDAWRIGALLWGAGGNGELICPAPRQQVGWAVVFIFAAAGWGYVEARSVHLRTVTVLSDKLKAGMPPLRLVQISDLHVGRTSRQEITDAVLARVQEARPDILVSTGDLVDAVDSNVDEVMMRLAAIQPRLGKFSITGNHEVYPGLEATLAKHRAAGFVVLRNEMREVAPNLRVAGVDDPAVFEMRGGTKPDEEDILASAAPDSFTIFLKHRPHVSVAARKHCDLQLSGHTHQGQLFPFGAIVRLLYPYPHGRLVNFAEGGRLYVSPGSGTWGPPIRFLARPEVTLFLICGSG